MNSPHSTQLDSLSDKGTAVRVFFQWQGDRFEHAIYAIHEQVATKVLTSVEGTPNEPWPPSLALQELSEHTSKDGSRALLLTGMSGTSHWSMSVEASQAPAERATLLFDVAVRIKQRPKILATTYEAASQFEWKIEDDICAVGYEQVHLFVSTACSITEVKGHRSCRRIGPAADPSLELPQTIRWQYRVTA